MINLDELLAPVRDDAPCGDDPWATGILSELETLALGKPETQFSKAEEPDWVQLKTRAIAVARTTKDLRVASILAATLLRTDGMKGFHDGIKLIRGYLENFWPGVFPPLDATENNDPSERVNALSNLAAPLGADGDLLKIIPGLRKVHLLSAPRTGRYGLEHYLAVREQMPWPEDAGAAPTLPLLDAAKKELGVEAVAAVVATVREISADLKAIERIFKEKAGEDQFPSFEPVQREFKQMLTWLGGAEAGAPVAEDGVPVVPGAAADGSAGPSFGGAVNNRADVLRALEAIIAYYRIHEPSSPVPFLLTRAIRIVPMDFLQVMNELTPEVREKIIMLVGAVESASGPS
jgi:type VI secretion system protein ImpA